MKRPATAVQLDLFHIEAWAQTYCLCRPRPLRTCGHCSACDTCQDCDTCAATGCTCECEETT